MCRHSDTDPRRSPSAGRGDWRQMLADARTFSQRTGAIRAAISMGAALGEIEEYLDQLSYARSQASTAPRDQPSMGVLLRTIMRSRLPR